MNEFLKLDDKLGSYGHLRNSLLFMVIYLPQKYTKNKQKSYPQDTPQALDVDTDCKTQVKMVEYSEDWIDSNLVVFNLISLG